MSSYHILNSSGSGSNFTTKIEYHIDIPVEQNPLTLEADYLRTRLQIDTDYVKLSEDPNISNPEQVNINQGEVLIRHESIRLNGDRPDHLVLLDARAAARTTELRIDALQELRDKYRYTSLVRDVV